MELPNLSESLLNSARQIQLLIMDVDGVLSDGKVYYSEKGEELKSFNIKDGLGIKLLHQHNIKTAIITGRQSAIVERRAKELGIEYVYQGQTNKQSAYEFVKLKVGLSDSEIAHIGDDLPDLPLMKRSGLGVAVNDAHWFVKQNADWVSPVNGGQGSIRPLVELLLTARGLLDICYQDYLNE